MRYTITITITITITVWARATVALYRGPRLRSSNWARKSVFLVRGRGPGGFHHGSLPVRAYGLTSQWSPESSPPSPPAYDPAPNHRRRGLPDSHGPEPRFPLAVGSGGSGCGGLTWRYGSGSCLPPASAGQSPERDRAVRDLASEVYRAGLPPATPGHFAVRTSTPRLLKHPGSNEPRPHGTIGGPTPLLGAAKSSHHSFSSLFLPFLPFPWRPQVMGSQPSEAPGRVVCRHHTERCDPTRSRKIPKGTCRDR